jgi:hypothetical protein
MLLPLELFLSECSDFFLHRWQSPPVGIMSTWEFKTDQPKTSPQMTLFRSRPNPQVSVF